MARRIIISAALLAAAILTVGYLAWQSRVASVRSAFDTKAALAQALLDDRSATVETLGKALASPDLRIAIEDRANGIVYSWQDGAVRSRPLPPPPPPGAPPPAPPPPRIPFAQLAGALSGRAPLHIPGDAFGVMIAPNVDALGIFLILDALLSVLGVGIVLVVATRMVSGLARAERAQLESTLEERRSAAKEFQRFLADAGHELRTPLTIVSGYVEILTADLETSERGKQILEGLRSETSRMKALVEKMLLLARLESPVSVPRLVDVGNVAAQVVAQMQARFPDREVILITSDRASIIIDHDDLYEALRNLVENALRYAPDSPVRIAVQPESNAASIAVTDFGEGIDPAERDKIFDRFYRGNARSDAEGSGLGLAIVSRVAARWNGAVRLQSVPGNTMFTLQFPLADEVMG